METALQKLTKAEQWLGEAKTLDDLKQIHDIATAAEAYAKAHRLGLSAENHAMEVRMLAARRIGELVPAEAKGGKPDRGSKARTSGIEIPTQRLSEFRKLAEIPEPEFKEKIEDLKEKEEKITYNRMLKTRINPPEIKDLRETRTQNDEKEESDALFQLKRWWKKTNKRDRAHFIKWAKIN